jgi:hypothetical protein
VRDLCNPRSRRWTEIARQLGIPHYYYLDDNFLVLNKENPELAVFTIENVRKELTPFRGVLAASQALADFLSENKIHPKVHYLPPVMPPNQWMDYSILPEKPAGVTRIGFMGGSHRHKEFMEFVFPAIRRLAKDRAVELVIGGDDKIDNNNYPEIKIYHFPFNTSYRLALGRMQSANIDILVHAGSDTRNNPYKTHNTLLNAWALKALPILANQPPYEDIENLGLGLLCNSTDEWYENLYKGVSDPTLVSQIQEFLHRYVIENFSGLKNLEVLNSITQEYPVPGFSLIDHRYRLYIDILTRDVYQPADSDLNVARSNSRLESLIRRNRSWLLPANSARDRFARFLVGIYFSLKERTTSQLTTGNPLWNPLMAQGMVRLVHKLEYKLRPQAQQWIGFEFMIGTHDKRAAGQINIEIIDESIGRIVRNQNLDLNEIHDNQIVQVNFEKIRDSKDKDFKVLFLLKAVNSETSISIYEKDKMEPKLHRILRRFGILTRGNTLACRLLYGDA